MYNKNNYHAIAHNVWSIIIAVAELDKTIYKIKAYFAGLKIIVMAKMNFWSDVVKCFERPREFLINFW